MLTSKAATRSSVVWRAVCVCGCVCGCIQYEAMSVGVSECVAGAGGGKGLWLL
jgi:hypothetical protein